MYWLARMLEAGEDARFIARRMVIFASEDVGMADPQALVVAVAAAHAARVRRPAGGPAQPGPGRDPPGHRAEEQPQRRWPSGTPAPTSRAGALGEVPAHLRDAHYQGASVLGHGVGLRVPS